MKESKSTIPIEGFPPKKTEEFSEKSTEEDSEEFPRKKNEYLLQELTSMNITFQFQLKVKTLFKILCIYFLKALKKVGTI